jgi:hypothetical protein
MGRVGYLSACANVALAAVLSTNTRASFFATDKHR